MFRRLTFGGNRFSPGRLKASGLHIEPLERREVLDASGAEPPEDAGIAEVGEVSSGSSAPGSAIVIDEVWGDGGWGGGGAYSSYSEGEGEDPPPEDPPPEDPPPEDPPPEDPPPEDPPPEDPPPEDPPPEDPPEEEPEMTDYGASVGEQNILTVTGEVAESEELVYTVHIMFQGVEYTRVLSDTEFYWQYTLQQGESGMVFTWVSDQFGRESEVIETWASG